MLLPWDELNVIRSKVENLELADTAEDGKKKYDAEKCIDIIYEYLEMAWTMGVKNTNENLSTSFAPQEDEMRREIYRKVAGKDYSERVREWAEKGDLDAIIRVAETEAHRVLNTASVSTAKRAGARYKTWRTMEDDRVREAHEPLDTIRIPIDDYFVTWDGYRTDRPGNFGVPELDINCRCWLDFS